MKDDDRGEIYIEDDSLRAGFTVLPNYIWCRRVTVGAKLLYIALLRYAWGTERCFPGQKRLADDLWCSVKSIQRYLDELKEVGMVVVKRRGLTKTNVYIITKQQ